MLILGTADWGDVRAGYAPVLGNSTVLVRSECSWHAVEKPRDQDRSRRSLTATLWFLEGGAERTARVRPGPWAEAREAAFYVALYLRAAQYSLRHGCPMTYS